MTENSKIPSPTRKDPLPFPLEWLRTAPERVEEALNSLSLREQARCLLQVSGRERQDLLLLCRNAPGVVQLLPPEEVYLTVKEIGEEDALPLMAVLSPDQVQTLLDLEFWAGDRFLPDRAWSWLELLDRANDGHLLTWFQSEEFEQKVMVLQALLRVFKRDEMTDRYEGVEGMIHWSPDGVYDLFFKLKDSVPVLQRVFKQMLCEDAPLFRSLMEAVIWWPVTPTVERAWQWRLTRTAERGVPDFEEAIGVYSPLTPEALKTKTLNYTEIEETLEVPMVAPRFPLSEADPATFLGQCLAMMKNQDRFDAICWELLVLSNKVLVADRQDLGDLEARRQTLRKTLGYINLGLELGAGEDIARGVRLLHQAWMQALFQVGYAAGQRLRWEAEALLRDQGGLVRKILGPAVQDHLMALMERFPKIGVLPAAAPDRGRDEEAPEIEWRDLRSLADLTRLQGFLAGIRFEARLVQRALDLTEEELARRAARARHPSEEADLDTLTLLLTAFAHYTLYGTVQAEPLPDAAARSFLKVVFLPSPFPEEDRVVQPDLLETFRGKLLDLPLAWTPEDQKQLDGLLQRMKDRLIGQFGRLNPEEEIQWAYTRGLWIQ